MIVTVNRNPLIRDGVRKLVDAHRNRQEQSTRLAIWYDTSSLTNVRLFEVIEDWPVDAEDPITEAVFGPTVGLPLPSGGALFLALTSPAGATLAVEQSVPVIQDIRDAFGDGNAEVIHEDGTQEMMELVAQLAVGRR